jgi:putative nucleotidyltransferase with HDIG domain
MNLPRILIVDDYSPTRNLVAEALSQTGEYQVFEAENGREAMGLFQENPFDLVISDIMMPQVSGLDLLTSVLELAPGTPVIMMTAHAAAPLTVSALKKGAVDFLQKPFDLDELLFKVKLYLRDKEEARILPDQQTWTLLSGLRDEVAVHRYINESLDRVNGNNDEIFDLIVGMALQILSGATAYLLIYDNERFEWQIKAFKTKTPQLMPSPQNQLWRRLWNEVTEKRRGLVCNHEDEKKVPYSLVAAPLAIRGRVLGMLVVLRERQGALFSRKEVEILEMILRRAALEVENNILYESIYGNVLDTFQSLITSIEVRDHYTQSHSLRVSKMAVTLARSMNFLQTEIQSLRIAAMLHDIGKISVPDNILLKSGGLTAEEYAIIKNHSSVGESIIKPIALLDREKQIVRHHHERFDGRGYPDGLAGEKIPALARVLTVVDSFDAMVQKRPYREAKGIEWAYDELKRYRGTQFDPEVVDLLLKTDWEMTAAQ